MRDASFAAGPIEMQQQIARSIQSQFWQDLPFIPLGQYFIDSAWRRDVGTGIPEDGAADQRAARVTPRRFFD